MSDKPTREIPCMQEFAEACERVCEAETRRDRLYADLVSRRVAPGVVTEVFDEDGMVSRIFNRLITEY